MSNTTNTTTSAPGSDSLSEVELYTFYAIAGAASLFVFTRIISCLRRCFNKTSNSRVSAKEHTEAWAHYATETDSITDIPIIIESTQNNEDASGDFSSASLSLSTSQLLEATSSPGILKHPSTFSSSLSTSQTLNTRKRVQFEIFKEHKRKLDEPHVALNSSPKANSQTPSPKKCSHQKQRLLGSSGAHRRTPTVKTNDDDDSKEMKAPPTPRYGSFDNQ